MFGRKEGQDWVLGLDRVTPLPSEYLDIQTTNQKEKKKNAMEGGDRALSSVVKRGLS